MKPMIILLVSLLIWSCSPQRRLTRLIEKHPELKTTDTLTVRDTVTIPGIRADTTIPASHLPDTIVIEKGRLEVILRKVHDTLYISGKCKPDTLIIEKKIPVERIKLVKEPATTELVKKIPWIVSGIIALLAFGIVLMIRLKP